MTYSVTQKDKGKISKFIKLLKMLSQITSAISILWGVYLYSNSIIAPALGLILSGLILWLWHQEKRKARLAIFPVICLVLLIFGEIVEMVSLVSHVDFWKIPGNLEANVIITFMSLSIALFLLLKTFYSAAQFFSLMAFLISLIGFLAEVYQIKKIYGFGFYTIMLLPTNITMVLLSLGILFAAPEHGWIRTFTSENAGGIMARRMSPIAIAMPLIVGWLILIGYRSYAYSPEIAITLSSVLNIIFFNWVVWCTARFLTRVDSQRQQVQKALQENEIKFQAIFEQSFQFVALLQPDGTLVEVNQAALDFAKVSLLDVVNKPFWQTRWWINEERLITRLSLTINEILSPVQEQLKSAINQAARGELIRYEVDVWGGNNQVATIDFSLKPLRDRTGEIILLIAEGRDISDRKRFETALREREQFLASIYDGVNYIICVVDVAENGNITYAGWNPATEKITGISSQASFGKTPEELFPPNLSSEFREGFNKCLAAKASISYESCTRVDNEEVWLIATLTPLQDRVGKIYRIIATSTYITERKKAEIALQKSEAQFRKLAQQEALINRIANQIRNSLDIDRILETTVNEARSLLQIDRAAFGWYHYDSNPQTWECVKEAKNDLLPSILGLYKATVLGPLCEKILKREIFQVDEAKTFPDPILREFLLELRYTSILILPIQTQSGKVGAFSFGHTNDKRPFTDNEVELIEAVGVQLAIALNQAELYAQSRERNQQLEIALQELQQTQTQLIQSEKMSSLGQMVAGVAHEINNPVSFIYGNIQPANDYIKDLLKLLELYQVHYPFPAPQIQMEAEAIDLEFLVEDLPKLLNSMKVGATRIKDIVQSLRIFSRLDEADMKVVNIHEGIDSTIMILEHRLKAKPHFSGISLLKNYHKIPLVECYPGQLNQVFMNILANAIDALETQPEPRNITITTQVKHQLIIINIADNGAGMSQDIKSKIFDPFFTTKSVGKGTGLGLSISHSIIVEKHNGKLKCNSQLGQGTEFIIEIPVRQK